MAISKAQQRATSKYVKANYDRIEVKVPKGDKERYKAHAEQMGESLNGFIQRSISETMERDSPSEACGEPVSAFIKRTVVDYGAG